MEKYNKASELYEKLRGISKKYNVSILVKKQEPREFSGYQKEIILSPLKGKNKYLGMLCIDHINLIK